MNRNLVLYLETAKQLKLSMEYRAEFAGLSLKLGRKTYYFRDGFTPFNAGSNDRIALNKYSVNHLLSKANFHVPFATAVSIHNFKQGSWELPKLSYPLVAKPTIGSSYGRDVFCNIKNESILINYLNEKVKKHEFISLESFEGGLTDYRVLVFFGKVIGVTRRDPSAVIGNGKNTIAELIASDNEKRLNIRHVTLDTIKIDQELHTKLAELNISLNYIPKKNEKVVLCYTCNSNRGGTMTSLGKSICPENAKLASDAAKLLGLNLVGFDIICEDIMRPIKTTRGFIIEANANPDLTIHESPLAGIKVPVIKIFLKHLLKKHPLYWLINYLKNTIIFQAKSYEQSRS